MRCELQQLSSSIPQWDPSALETEVDGLRLAPCAPVGLREQLTADECAALVEHHRDSAPRRRVPGSPESAPVPTSEDWLRLISGPMLRLSEHFQLPVTHLESYTLRYYPEGRGQGWHLDNDPSARGFGATPDQVNLGRGRVISYSLLLNSPKTAYTGGAVVTPFGSTEDLELTTGDALGFTAKTPHAVEKVYSGERFALVCFGRLDSGALA